MVSSVPQSPLLSSEQSLGQRMEQPPASPAPQCVYSDEEGDAQGSHFSSQHSSPAERRPPWEAASTKPHHSGQMHRWYGQPWPCPPLPFPMQWPPWDPWAAYRAHYTRSLTPARREVRSPPLSPSRETSEVPKGGIEEEEVISEIEQKDTSPVHNSSSSPDEAVIPPTPTTSDDRKLSLREWWPAN